jgi:hypothetical protein
MNALLVMLVAINPSKRALLVICVLLARILPSLVLRFVFPVPLASSAILRGLRNAKAAPLRPTPTPQGLLPVKVAPLAASHQIPTLKSVAHVLLVSSPISQLMSAPTVLRVLSKVPLEALLAINALLVPSATTVRLHVPLACLVIMLTIRVLPLALLALVVSLTPNLVQQTVPPALLVSSLTPLLNLPAKSALPAISLATPVNSNARPVVSATCRSLLVPPSARLVNLDLLFSSRVNHCANNALSASILPTTALPLAHCVALVPTKIKLVSLFVHPVLRVSM